MRKNRHKTLDSSAISPQAAWWLVAAVLLFTAAVRIRLLAVPLERDEGEFAYVGQLILQGIPPYKLACNMKLPGTYTAYAAIMGVFGQTIQGIHVGLLLVNAAAIVLVFLLARRLFDTVTAVAACATYGMISLSWGVMGGMAHATHFVVLFALIGMMLLLRALESDRLAAFFWAGLMFGLSFLMKQPGLFFLAFAVFYAGWRIIRGGSGNWGAFAARVGALAVGGTLPFAITCLVLWAAGVFDKFWFWTFTYGLKYASELPLKDAPKMLSYGLSLAAGCAWTLWVLPVIGLTAIAWDRQVRARVGFLLSFLAFSFAAVSIGFYYRHHYFIMMLPALALLAGCAVSAAWRLVSTHRSAALRSMPAVVFVVALAYPAWVQRDYFFTLGPAEASRALYGANPFPEAVEVGKYLKSHAARGDLLAVMGSEPEIYFYSGLHGATTCIYTYSLMETQPFARRMQDDVITEIETARPRYLVAVVSQSSWTWKPTSERHIFYWFEDYCRRHYERVGLVDMITPLHVSYYWDADAASARPSSDVFIEVYRRRGG